MAVAAHGRTHGATPKGRDEVRRALIDAAAELFAEQGPARVGVREIADRARVNHGLVHRHFGSKDNLLRAVLDDLSGRIWRGIDVPPSSASPSLADGMTTLSGVFDAVARNPRYFRVLARALLDGYEPRDLQSAYPVVEALVAALDAARGRGEVDPRIEPRMAVALLVSTALGWLVFEPYVLLATGQDDLPLEEARARVVAMRSVLSTLVSGKG
jgi:AcrR family transcriptional regulator